MVRQVIKSISALPVKFIPKSHALDPTLNEGAPEIVNRPLVFFVKKISRDGHFKIRELLELKDVMDPKKGVIGSGDVAKYIWENFVIEVRNVAIDENGETKFYESLVGEEKNRLWDTEGMDQEITEAILFARSDSMLDAFEVKN